jgi:hypothetical protein
MAGCDGTRIEKAQFRVACEEDNPGGDKAAIDRCVAEKFVAAHPKLH